jgi:hypothetical protein
MCSAGDQQYTENDIEKFFSALALRSLCPFGELGSADIYRRDAENAEKQSFLLNA